MIEVRLAIPPGGRFSELTGPMTIETT